MNVDNSTISNPLDKKIPRPESSIKSRTNKCALDSLFQLPDLCQKYRNDLQARLKFRQIVQMAFADGAKRTGRFTTSS